MTAQRKAELDRIAPLEPNGIGDTALITVATPGKDVALGATMGLVIMSRGDDADDIAGQQLLFANPIAGAQLYQEMNIVRSKAFTNGYLITGTYVWVPFELTPGGCTPVQIDAHVVAIPTNIALDDRTLTTDTVAIFDRDSVLSWDVTSSGASDHFVVRVFEVTATGTVFRHSIITTKQRAKPDPTWFEAQHRYVLYVEARLGLPKANEGDFRETGPTWARGFAHTPILTAQ